MTVLYALRRLDPCAAHRLGDSGEGIGSIAPALKLPHVKYVCPTAPNRPVSINMGMAMNAWFDLRGFGAPCPMPFTTP